METVSENSKGRGRPRKYGPAEYGYLKEFERYESDPVRGVGNKDVFTMRQQQNIILAERASDYLKDYYMRGEGVLSYDEEGIPKETTERYDLAGYITEMAPDIPQRVFTELGRFLMNDDEENFWRALLWYESYPWKLRAQDAARIIREFRLGKRVALPGE